MFQTIHFYITTNSISTIPNKFDLCVYLYFYVCTHIMFLQNIVIYCNILRIQNKLDFFFLCTSIDVVTNGWYKQVHDMYLIPIF